MSRRFKLNYNFSVSEEDFLRLVRRFKTDALLKRINLESISLLNDKNAEIPNARIGYFHYYPRGSKIERESYVYVTPW